VSFAREQLNFEPFSSTTAEKTSQLPINTEVYGKSCKTAVHFQDCRFQNRKAYYYLLAWYLSFCTNCAAMSKITPIPAITTDWMSIGVARPSITEPTNPPRISRIDSGIEAGMRGMIVAAKLCSKIGTMDADATAPKMPPSRSGSPHQARNSFQLRAAKMAQRD
jgi:hypothetical protein